MDLKNFVAETLTQIVEGVADAQRRVAEGGTNALINPTTVWASDVLKQGDAKPVEFDVALVVASESTDTSSAKVGGSVGFLSVVTAKIAAETGTQAESAQKSESVSRVRFSVMLSQPALIQERRDPVIPRNSNPYA